MTERELRRRVYLETANAISMYLGKADFMLMKDAEAVDRELRKSAEAFLKAADAMKETQEAGLP